MGPTYPIVLYNTLGGEAGEELADAFARGCGEAALDLADHERAVSVRQEGKYGAIQGVTVANGLLSCIAGASAGRNTV